MIIQKKSLTGAWMGFTPDTKSEVAEARFLQEHGEAPAGICRTGGGLLVGPISGTAERREPIDQPGGIGT